MRKNYLLKKSFLVGDLFDGVAFFSFFFLVLLNGGGDGRKAKGKKKYKKTGKD